MPTSVDSREGERFCLLDPEKLRAPFEDYVYFRERRPVFFHPEMGAWFVFRHEDVDRLFHDSRLSSARMTTYVDTIPASVRGEVADLLCGPFSRWVLSLDGAEHRRVRRQLQPSLAEHEVARLAPRIQTTVDELLDEASPGGRMDVATDLAYPLPVAVICDLLGVRREDRSRVLGWSDDLATFFNQPPATFETSTRMARAAREMMAYVTERLAEHEAGSPASEMLSRLLGGSEASGGLTRDEILANAVVLLVAGHETTRNLIGSAARFLLTDPEQRARVAADPGLWRDVIEETLRLEPANPIMSRVATEDVEVAGETIRRGDLVFLCIGSANRDPAAFANPEAFDLSRGHDVKHLAFGSGPHYCVGAILARREADVALRTLFGRFPEMRLDEERPAEMMCLAGLRGPRSLPVWL